MKEFDKIIGYEPVKLELKRIADMMVNQQKYKNLGVRMPKGLLLFGKPGVGKTLMANCLIAASKRKFFVCRKDKPNGDFIKELKRIYGLAKENAPSIVFLDDMDKFANEDERHKNAEEYVTIQACIDELGNKDVFTIATVNSKKNLPDSLLRAGRFDKNIKIEIPEGDDAVKIIEHYLKQKKYVSEIDLTEIARILIGKSCAELETVINEAGIYAGYLNKQSIEFEDIIKAYMRVIFNEPEDNLKEDDFFDEPEDDLKKEDIFIENLACHEAGHAVVAEVLEPGSVSLVSISRHIGETGGITSYYQDGRYWKSKKNMENHVIGLLAGKAAIEIKYGDCCDVGANEDIDRAIYIVESLVGNYCEYGFDKFEFLARSSDEFRLRRENAIYAEMEKYYQMAKKIIVDNKQFFDSMVRMLIEKKTLISKDIQEIKNSIKTETLIES